jgi:hypothetical protein
MIWVLAWQGGLAAVLPACPQTLDIDHFEDDSYPQLLDRDVRASLCLANNSELSVSYQVLQSDCANRYSQCNDPLYE